MRKLSILSFAIVLVLALSVSCSHPIPEPQETHTHIWDDGVITVSPTCVTNGEKTYTCTICNEKKKEPVKASSQYHDINTSTHTCKTCGEMSYFQGSFEANKVNVNLRASFYSTSLPELVIPEYVWNYNYTSCYRIEVIKSVPNSTVQTLTISEGATTIYYQAFSNKTNLHTVNLPSTLTTIEQEAFMGSGLTQIHIPASVTTIGNQALAYCESLTDIYYAGTLDQWSALISGKNVTKGTTATMHYQSN